MDEVCFPFLDFTMRETISVTANHKSRGRRDGIFVTPEEVYCMADRIFPGHRLGIEIVIHVKDGEIHVARLFQGIRRDIGIQHDLGTGENKRIRTAGSGTDFAADQASQKIGVPVFFTQPL